MNQIYNKLLYQESMTIHRLLKYNPANNQFTYNADNRFPNHTIFVIDEASMIDIDLFAKFMEALPEDRSKYRLYILGDPYQLPSVEAGAVLGEVLESAPDSKVELDVSYRFRSDSEIGKLAGVIKEMASHPEMNIKPNREFVLLPDKVWFRPETCQYYMLVPDAGQDSLSHKERKARLEARTKALNSLVKQWCECFYSHLIEMASRIDPVRLAENMPDPETLDQLGALWKIADSARLLSAEKNGLLGTGSLNALVRGFLMERLGADCPDHPDLKSHFFTGQILMLARNQNMLKLYNGDTGIVIGEKNTGRKYLLLQKSSRSRDGDVIVPYTLYALSLLPEESLESAFAMTIHKSQGSGYENIMMFLPENPGHPLLNNQIVYTGVTRTKNGSLTIVSNHDAFEYACKTVIRRDTGIVVSS